VAATSSNDALARLVRAAGPRQWVVWECECDRRCHDSVPLPLREFDDRRARDESIVAPGHRDARAA
jgi:hypothetical protein